MHPPCMHRDECLVLRGHVDQVLDGRPDARDAAQFHGRARGGHTQLVRRLRQRLQQVQRGAVALPTLRWGPGHPRSRFDNASLGR